MLELSITQWIIIGILGFILLAFIIAAAKGLIKLLLLASAIIGGILTYFWLQKYGFTYLTFLTSTPSSWMVTTLSWIGAITVFGVFQQGLSWFSHIFSWGKNSPSKLGGIKGIITTLLVVFVIIWLISLAISHFGQLSDIQRFKDVSKDAHARTNPSLISRLNHKIETSSFGAMAHTFNPMYDPERIKLAKIMSYLGSETSASRLNACQAALMPLIPDYRKLQKLASDSNIQMIIKNDNMGALFSDPKITKILSDEKMRGALKTVEPDKLFGMTH